MPELRADCARCFGLCCVVPAFAASSDFAVAKPAGAPCRNLLADSRCGIHESLTERGFRGCTVFDCFGAGQHTAQGTFGGRDWRSDPAVAESMGTVFPVMRDLHELLWYLTEAAERAPAADLDRLLAETERLTELPADALATVDVDAHRARVGPLLARVSETVRVPAGRDHRRADLTGRRLARADLRRATLRGAALLGADLSGADLRAADLLGADLRGANVAGADLSTALFLTQFQVNATRGDHRTRLPDRVIRPPRWPAPAAGHSGS